MCTKRLEGKAKRLMLCTVVTPRLREPNKRKNKAIMSRTVYERSRDNVAVECRAHHTRAVYPGRLAIFEIAWELDVSFGDR